MEHSIHAYEVVREINSTPTKAVMIVTGGGSGIFPLLLERGGGSGTLLSGIVPYVQEETIGLLGGKPDKFVSEQTARSLAMAAYQKAVKLCTDGSPVIGLSCTASLQTIPSSEEREGRKHRVFMALQTATKTVSVTLEMEQHKTKEDSDGVGHRLWEENICIMGILKLLAEGCEVQTSLPDDRNVKLTRKECESATLANLLDKQTRVVMYGRDLSQTKVIFPGSFNPVHPGHMEMVNMIRNNPKLKDESKTVAFEISMFNVDKPPLDFITITERVEQLQNMGETVYVTNAPTFVEKAKLFQNKSFIVGYDTAVRILDPRYAGPIDKVLQTFKENGNYFYIFPRQGLVSFALPGEYITEPGQFEQVSSSNLRKEATV